MKEIVLVLALSAFALMFNSSPDNEEEESTHRVGFKPSLWGPGQWRMLHMTAMNLPRQYCDATHKFERYLFATNEVLPCLSCRLDFAKVLKRVPVHSFLKKGRAGAIALMYTLHAIVSDRLGKKIQPMFLEEEVLLREYAGNVAAEDVALIMAELKRDHLNHRMDDMINKVFENYKH